MRIVGAGWGTMFMFRKLTTQFIGGFHFPRL